MRKTVFIRHGATEGTAHRRYSGAGSDEPLSAAGLAALREMCAAGMPLLDAALDAAGVLSGGSACATVRRAVRHIYTSGMTRCAQTACVLFPEAAHVAVPDLREMDFGAFEGKSFLDLKDDACYRAWVEAMCEPACPGGEGKQEFVERCVRAFLAVMAEEGAWAGAAVSKPEVDARGFAADGSPVVFVVHAGTIRALFSELAEPVMEYFSVETKPGSAWACEWDGRVLRNAKPGNVFALLGDAEVNA